MDLPPPPVTIENPADPSRSADVLDAGDPWRPTSSQVRRAAGVLALLALLSGGWVLVQDERQERAARRALLAQQRLESGRVAMSLPSADCCPIEGSEEALHVTLHNDGQDLLTVLSVRYGSAASWTPTEDVVALPQSDADLFVPFTEPCSATVGAQPVTSLRVRVRLPHGSEVSRVLRLDPGVADSIAASRRYACGTQLPHEALSSYPVSVRTSGRTVVLRLRIENGAATPLSVGRIAAAPGLRAELDREPLVVPSTVGSATPSFRDVTVRVTVTSCRELARSFTTSFFGLVSATASNANGSPQQVRLTLDDVQGEPFEPETRPAVAGTTSILRLCPGTRFEQAGPAVF